MVNIITHIRSDSRRSLRRPAIIGSPPLCQTYDETAVTIDLLCTEAERLSLQYGAGADAPVTQDIKTVSDRLGRRPVSVRQAYEQLDALGGVQIVARRFPRGKRQRRLPLGDT